MMAKVPVAGQTYTFGVNVVSQGDTDIYQAAATIAAGDFQRSINGAAFENLDNLPTVTPAGGKRIQIVLSAAETTAAGAGGHIHIVGSDAAGTEWQDISIEVTVYDADVPTGDIYGIVSNAGYGNSALATGIAAIPTTAAPSAADVADAVADEVLSGHADAGSLAVAITDILTDTGTTLPGAIAGVAAAVWGYTTRTLTSLSALVASIAAAVWAYATRTLTSTAAVTTAAVTGSALTITRAATYSATLSGLTISASWTALYLTIKRSKKSLDSGAVLQIVVSNPAAAATDGALYVEGAAATATQRTQAGLTVDQAAGTVTIAIADDLAYALAEHTSVYYDVKELLGGTSASHILTASTVTIEDPVTLAI